MTDKQYNRITVNYEVFHMYENKNAKAIIANGTMEEIILERYLSNTIPISNQFSLKKVYKYTGNDYYRLRNYIESNLYTISKDLLTLPTTNDYYQINRKNMSKG